MALFGKDKKQDTAEAQESKTTDRASAQNTRSATHAVRADRAHEVIRRPRITEKAAAQAEANTYTFEVAQGANKTEIKKAIQRIYNVTPTQVRITRTPSKTFMTRRGETGTKQGVKKAIVRLKEGDRIEFV